MSGRYTALYHGAHCTVRGEGLLDSIMDTVNVVYSTRPKADCGVSGLMIKNSKVLSQGSMHLKETSISF